MALKLFHVTSSDDGVKIRNFAAHGAIHVQACIPNQGGLHGQAKAPTAGARIGRQPSILKSTMLQADGIYSGNHHTGLRKNSFSLYRICICRICIYKQL